jgi:hypothetical protein
MTDRENTIVERVDLGTHAYVIRYASSAFRHSIEIVGTEGSYTVEEIPYLENAREIGPLLPAPVPELHGARLVAGRRDGLCYLYARSKEHAGALEDGKVYAAHELAALVPTPGMPVPDLLVAAREETDHFDDAVIAEFGRVMTTYGINLSDETYYDSGFYFLENEAEIIDDEMGMDVIAARAGYDSYTQFQYDDAGESVLSRPLHEVEKMDWIDRIGLSPQMVVDFVLESSEKVRDDMLGELFREYRNSGMPEMHFKGGRRSPDEIRSAAATNEGPAA